MAFQNFDIFARQAPRRDGTVTASAVSALLCAEYCEAGPGWVPSFRSDMHCLVIPLTGAPVRLSTIRDGVARPVRLEPGMIAVTKARTAAAWSWDEPLRALLVWVEPATLREFIEGEMRTIALDSGLFDRITLRDPELCDIAAQLADAIRADRIGAEVVVDALAAVFLVVLVRNHALSWGAERLPHRAPLGPERFRKLVSFVMAHLSERLTLPRMAAELGMSPSALSKAMRESVGAGPAEFVQRLRLKTARRMMRDPALPLKEISAACGFADQAHLSRCFKQRYGVPPRLYRRGIGPAGAETAPEAALISR